LPRRLPHAELQPHTRKKLLSYTQIRTQLHANKRPSARKQAVSFSPLTRFYTSACETGFFFPGVWRALRFARHCKIGMMICGIPAGLSRPLLVCPPFSFGVSDFVSANAKGNPSSLHSPALSFGRELGLISALSPFRICSYFLSQSKCCRICIED